MRILSLLQAPPFGDVRHISKKIHHMLSDPFQSAKETEKRKLRFIEDIQLELAVAKLPLRIVDANPMDKTIQVAGEYTDYLLAKKIGAAKKWAFERA